MSISLELAKTLVSAASTFATANRWNVVIAIVDDGGHLVLLERMNNAQKGSVKVAEMKARSSVLFKRPTKLLEEAVAAGKTGMLHLPDALCLEGGIPLTSNERIVGAVGVSGVTAQQDGQIAQAALLAFEDAK